MSKDNTKSRGLEARYGFGVNSFMQILDESFDPTIMPVGSKPNDEFARVPLNVASIELCKELYEVSGWYQTEDVWAAFSDHKDMKPVIVRSDHGELGHQLYVIAPAYDSGYLLRHLPGHYVQKHGNESYRAHWHGHAPTKQQRELGHDHISGDSSSSPENALCRLAIYLFRMEILERPEK